MFHQIHGRSIRVSAVLRASGTGATRVMERTLCRGISAQCAGYPAGFEIRFSMRGSVAARAYRVAPWELVQSLCRKASKHEVGRSRIS